MQLTEYEAEYAAFMVGYETIKLTMHQNCMTTIKTTVYLTTD